MQSDSCSSPKKLKDSLFGAAVLKLSMIQKGLGGEAGFRVVYASTLRELKLLDSEVDAYIEKNKDRLLAHIAKGPLKG
jgi:hypothetical protein